MYFYEHVLLETAGHSLQPPALDVLDEAIEQRLRQLRGRRAGEARAPALARVRKQCELADDEQFGPDIQGREIELALRVVEDAQVNCPVGEIRGVFLKVVPGHAHQDYQATPYFRDQFPGDGHPSQVNALQQGLQRVSPVQGFLEATPSSFLASGVAGLPLSGFVSFGFSSDGPLRWSVT